MSVARLRREDDLDQQERFRQVVESTCAAQGIKPPGRIRITDNPKRHASATSLRLGRLGSGFIVSTRVMVADLDDEELGVVVRHELAHYRHGEARWALLQTLFCFAPFLVVIFGWQISHLVGRVGTLVLYALSIGLHVLAFKSKRVFEARADRESVRNRIQAQAAQRALLKFATLKERTVNGLSEDESERLINEFALKVQQPPTMTDRMFNAIWGVHPLLRDRLRRYELLGAPVE